MLVVRADGFVDPCIPSRAPKPPSGPDWVHEIKHDGYRLIVRRDGKAVHLFTRRGYDWTDRYPAIAATAAKLRAKSFTLDGEAAVSDAAGIAVFEALHRRRIAPGAVLYAFDLLELNGKDLRSLPLGERKAKLARLVAGSTAGIVFNEHTDEDGVTVLRHACRFGFEGIVSKRLTAPYRSGPVARLAQGEEPGQSGDDKTSGRALVRGRLYLGMGLACQSPSSCFGTKTALICLSAIDGIFPSKIA